jgi:hypothetical protein
LGYLRTFHNEHIPSLDICLVFLCSEQAEHDQPLNFNDYVNETMRDTMENWQSEFLQLMWQVVGLSILWFIGSSQSKESDDRLEEKIDLIIQRLDSENGKRLIQELDKKFPRKQ